MSGHSKWHSIRHKKAAVDAKKGNLFTKFGRNITVAAKELGGDIETNFKLRMAIDKARGINMPKDVIERAIKKGTGELAGDILFEMVYEGFGPEGSAIVIEAVTDNKNRTVSNIKTILSKNGGNLGASNSVLWMFERKGVVFIDKKEFGDRSADSVELMLIDLGAEDISVDDGDNESLYRVVTSLEDLKNFQEALEAENIKPTEANLEYLAKEELSISQKGKETLEKLLSLLDEDDDIGSLHTNVSL